MLTYALILALLFLLELLYFRVALRLGIVDRPNLRSSHTHVTLRGGGIVFVLGMWLYSAFYGFPYPYFLAGLTAASAVSFADDVRSVPNKVRLCVHFASMLLLFADWGILSPGSWWAVLPALVLCVGIMNAYNFMDGINGITGGYSLAVLLPLWWADRSLGFVDPRLLVVAVLGVLVFCFFNFRRRARCFAGDVGSIGIALVVVFALGRLILQTGDFTYILLLAVYGVDSVLTIVHRLLLREDLGKAHRKHAYQLMANELGLPHVAVSSVYMCLQLAVSCGLLLLPPGAARWWYLLAVVAALSLAYVAFMRKYYHLHEEYLARRESGGK